MQQDIPAFLWQEALQQAINESDPRLANAKIQTAEVAIFHRIDDFSPSSNALEERALFDALDTIRLLRAAADGTRPTDIQRRAS